MPKVHKSKQEQRARKAGFKVLWKAYLALLASGQPATPPAKVR